MQPLIRIFLRYLSGALMAHGMSDLALADDPDVLALAETIAGAALGALSEWWRARAKKVGGAM